MRAIRQALRRACCLLLLLAGLTIPAGAVTWEFGTAGKGENAFMPRGYLIAAEDGLHWLSSRFDNSGSTTMYTSKLNGVSYIDATKVDGSGYTLYAFTDRNPLVYQYLIAYKNGELIPDFSSYAGAPGRLSGLEGLGSGANWAIPIQGFQFEPGCYYEFAFRRGMQANNGVTLVFSNDGLGYIQNPETEEEIAKYEADKDKEYQFISSYWREDLEDGSYIYNFNLVPMRFTVQTYADVTIWETAAEEAQAFLDSLAPGAVDGVTYHQENIDNLTLLLENQQEQIQRSVRTKLQPEAEELMAAMVEELDQALALAQSSSLLRSDISILEELLADAQSLYQTASGNVGTGKGQYAQNRVEELAAAIAAAQALHDHSPQAAIDNAITDLRSAIVQTYNSVVREEMQILYDQASGVSVLAPMGALPEDAVLYVDEVEDNIPSAQPVRQALGDTAETVAFYQIQIMSGDQVVQPTQEVDVQLVLTGDQAKRAVTVYAADSADTLARISSVTTGSRLLFQTDQLGVFALTTRASTAEHLGEGDTPPSEETSGETATIVDITDVPVNEQPDQTQTELEETPAQEETQPPQEEPEPRPDPQLLEEVDIPLDGLTRSGQPTVFLLCAGALVVLAAALAVERAARRLQKPRRR